jgi:hypothetical protein
MQNVVLLIINSVGVWRYLLSPSRKEAAGPVEQARKVSRTTGTGGVAEPVVRDLSQSCEGRGASVATTM